MWTRLRWVKLGLCAQPSHSLLRIYVASISTSLPDLKIRNQHDILKTAVAYVSKGQTDMSYKGEFQTLTKLSMRHQVCPGETCHITISESTITMLMSRGRSNSGGHSNTICAFVAIAVIEGESRKRV